MPFHLSLSIFDSVLFVCVFVRSDFTQIFAEPFIVWVSKNRRKSIFERSQSLWCDVTTKSMWEFICGTSDDYRIRFGITDRRQCCTSEMKWVWCTRQLVRIWLLLLSLFLSFSFVYLYPTADDTHRSRRMTVAIVIVCCAFAFIHSFSILSCLVVLIYRRVGGMCVCVSVRPNIIYSKRKKPATADVKRNVRHRTWFDFVCCVRGGWWHENVKCSRNRFSFSSVFMLKM